MEPSLQCFLIDDIFTLLVELDYIPYGVSKSINQMIQQRDAKAGLDEAASKCIRMIKFAIEYAEKHTEGENNIDCVWSVPKMNFKNQTTSDIMNSKYETGHYFIYLAYKIVIKRKKDVGSQYNANMEKTIDRVDDLLFYGINNITYTGCNSNKSFKYTSAKCDTIIRTLNLVNAMYGNKHRLIVSDINQGWECSNCSESTYRCECLQFDKNSKTISYDYKYEFVLKDHDNDPEFSGDENIVPHGTKKNFPNDPDRINWFVNYTELV